MLKDLYFGKISPWERRKVHSEEQRAISRTIEVEEKYFAEKMSPDDRERFQKLPALYAKLHEPDEIELFSYSLTLGMLLMTDVLEVAETIGVWPERSETD